MSLHLPCHLAGFTNPSVLTCSSFNDSHLSLFLHIFCMLLGGFVCLCHSDFNPYHLAHCTSVFSTGSSHSQNGERKREREREYSSVNIIKSLNCVKSASAVRIWVCFPLFLFPSLASADTHTYTQNTHHHTIIRHHTLPRHVHWRQTTEMWIKVCEINPTGLFRWSKGAEAMQQTQNSH